MRVAVILTARPSWAKLEPVCRALMARPDVELQIIACASALLERYGRVVDQVTAAGYPVVEEVWSVVEGATLQTSALETGTLLSALARTLSRLRPDCVVVCADRHEVLAAAQAARYLHAPLVHLQGGERSGSIDDRCRDAITQLADVHCVCTIQAKLRVYSLTGEYDAIHVTGCPSIDLAHEALSEPPVTTKELGGAGWTIDVQEPFVVVLQHSVTTEVEQAGAQMQATLDALKNRPEHVVCFWPGEDAGADAMSKVIRGVQSRIHTVRSLPPKRFLKLLTQCDVLVGNSSAGIRESSWLGIPVVNIGTRQHGRERGPNVIDVPHNSQQIADAVRRQIAHGPYRRSALYGDGNAGERTADVILGLGSGERARTLSSAHAGKRQCDAGDAPKVEERES